MVKRVILTVESSETTGLGDLVSRLLMSREGDLERDMERVIDRPLERLRDRLKLLLERGVKERERDRELRS